MPQLKLRKANKKKNDLSSREKYTNYKFIFQFENPKPKYHRLHQLVFLEFT
jgi:hypothetical protein